MSGPTGEALVEKAKAIRTKADFAAFVDLLLRNFHDHPEEWENNTLELFVQGLAGFVRSMGGTTRTSAWRWTRTGPGGVCLRTSFWRPGSTSRKSTSASA